MTDLQQVLTVTTERPSLRAEIVSWGCEDPSLYAPGKPIGLTPCPHFFYGYGTVLEALAAGWRLLGQPVKEGIVWEWWLVREVTHD